MKALMYGAGNIGRGFIGPLMNWSGYQVTFVDVNAELVEQLNRRGEYPLRILSDEGYQDKPVQGVDAILGTDRKAVVRAIAQCDLMATALGANILPRIAPVIAEGFQSRMKANGSPLNIIICENLPMADEVMREAIKAELPKGERGLVDSMLGLVEASIGRMVPVQTREMRDGDPLRVCVERYGFLPVDKAAFRGEMPKLEGMIPFTPFDFYMRRKLHLHNMGHAVCAYLGAYAGKTYIYEAIADSEIELIVTHAMMESLFSLAAAYNQPFKPLIDHVDDLIGRFGNHALGDTCQRVGLDIPRKMRSGDRLIGAALGCLSGGIMPSYIALGAAAALHRYISGEGLPKDEESARVALLKLAGADIGEQLPGLILEHYPLYLRGASLRELRLSAKRQKLRSLGAVV